MTTLLSAKLTMHPGYDDGSLRSRPIAVLGWVCEEQPDILITRVFGDERLCPAGAEYTGPSPEQRANAYLERLQAEGCPHDAYAPELAEGS